MVLFLVVGLTERLSDLFLFCLGNGDGLRLTDFPRFCFGLGLAERLVDRPRFFFGLLVLDVDFFGVGLRDLERLALRS